MVGTWQRDQRRAGVRVLLQALAENRIGRRDQAQAWVWRLAEFTRDSHEEYAVARWPETKRLLGLFVNSSGRAHGKNARRLVQAARGQDRRLAVALLAAAVAHTPEAEEVLRGARMRMARKPSAVARELLRNLPKGSGKKRRRRNKRSRDGRGRGPERQGRRTGRRRGRGDRRGRDPEPTTATTARCPVPPRRARSAESETVDLSDLDDETTSSRPHRRRSRPPITTSRATAARWRQGCGAERSRSGQRRRRAA